MFGCDFYNPNYTQMEPLIDGLQALNSSLKVNISFSTPSRFYKAIHEYSSVANPSTEWELFEPPDNDFFPYWTGFFTSQSAFKRCV